MAFVHLDKPNRLGKTRSEQDANMRKAGWSAGIHDEQIDRAKYLEKKLGERWYPAHMIDNVSILPPEGPPKSPSDRYRENYDQIRWDKKDKPSTKNEKP